MPAWKVSAVALKVVKANVVAPRAKRVAVVVPRTVKAAAVEPKPKRQNVVKVNAVVPSLLPRVKKGSVVKGSVVVRPNPC